MSSANLALAAQNPTALPTPVPGHARTLTVVNSGTQPALSLAVDVAGFPAGTLVTANNCSGTLAAAASCSITITPGTAPTAVPVTLTVTASNSNTVSASVVVLAYGSLYQGGHVFALDDGTAPTGSVGGKVLSMSDVSPGMPWSPDTALIAGIDQQSVSNCAGATDGACNTAAIVAHYNALGGNLTHAAGQCASSTAQAYTDWYLPAICEVSDDAASSGSGCGSSAAPRLQNIRSNLLGRSGVGALAWAYWSSSTQSAAPAFNAWGVFMQPGAPSPAIAKTFGNLPVRCVRQLTQ